MKKIAVASGKGGVGKSMLASSLVIHLSNEGKKIVAVDCDVDAPNLAIWLGETGKWDEEKEIETSERAVVDLKKCTGCGTCEKKCVFGAVKVVDGKACVSPFLCEGCGRCAFNCPEGAIHIEPVKNGTISSKKTEYGFKLFSGQLYPGESGSGKIVSAVKEEAEKEKTDFVILDTPPGTGCPVNAALRDVDYALLITEPTPSGVRDMERALDVVRHFKIEYGIVLNKWDINKNLASKIEKEAGKTFLGRISYDKEVMKAVSNLEPILETSLPAKNEIIETLKKIPLNK